MISSNDFRTGVTIVVDGQLWQVVDFQHVKPGKGSAFVRTRLKNVVRGNVLEKTFRAGEMLERAIVETRDMQYLYGSGDDYHFMDNTNYEQIHLGHDMLGDNVDLLKEGMVVSVQFHDGKVIAADLPNHVDLEIVETDPGFRGDTATNVQKPAKLETGATVNVPLFINPGDKVRIDTRDRKYVSRV
ncbi:MAG: elongation factor P [Candidatus Eremiobacteraeota bacterium]|nr:elongation factor P [Candidatus Eremiobacteraeota bacterium]MBV8338335.1 elongation factor P [Candidatus Eremiobacteraeota bacterium]MBV8461420.1 elongation factor P [Candidatus Eremiobacteraeota bacterium]MBV8595131.1 elongation factor P [Candidatus Eremiobacteraeota bacterium]MBV8668787.1 elongation factor P [Candidatus Eremiobacteraeota bacterium]